MRRAIRLATSVPSSLAPGEAGIDACSRPGAGEDRAVLDVERIDVDPGLREALPEPAWRTSSGCRTRARRAGRRRRARRRPAHREHARAAVHGVPQDLERLRPERSVTEPPGMAMRSASRAASSGCVATIPMPVFVASTRVGSSAQTRKSNGRHAVLGAVDPEDLAEDPELEWCDGFLHEDGDGAKHAPSVAQSWQKMIVHRQFCHSWR